ncbi:MAG TPA: hypothetical protein VM076_11005 [Gemmatimonadaceae bacterium]|nr:hypothetical protein [Gemmatimonadaceae bacterium]
MWTPKRAPDARHFSALLIAGLVAAAACNDRRPVEPAARPQAVAYITLSDSAPSAGDTVRVSVRLRAAIDVGSVGSFAATLRYDGAALTMVDEAPLGDAALRAINGTEAGVVRAAGAAAEGFGEAPLFAVRLRVVRPQALRSMRLDFSELNAVGRSDLKRAVRVADVIAAEPKP